MAIGETAPGHPRYEAVTTLPLEPGTYELRAAARHERTGDVGSVHAYLDVPDFNRSALTLSGVVLLDRNAPVIEIPQAHHHLILDQPLAFIAALRAVLADWEHSLPRRAKPAEI